MCLVKRYDFNGFYVFVYRGDGIILGIDGKKRSVEIEGKFFKM